MRVTTKSNWLHFLRWAGFPAGALASAVAGNTTLTYVFIGGIISIFGYVHLTKSGRKLEQKAKEEQKAMKK